MALSLKRYTRPEADASSTLNRILEERSKKEQESSTQVAVEFEDCLPELVMIMILSLLPVKDLVRYKCVCKSWHAIISRPDFISKHLKTYCLNNDAWHGCLLVQYCHPRVEVQLFELLVDETPRVSAYEVLHNMPMCGSDVYGPCDGLYYLYDGYDGRALWNPSLNEFKVLPPLIAKPNVPANFTCGNCNIYGFGFDPVAKDYKVVVIDSYVDRLNDEVDGLPLSLLVYSLSTDSWRYWGDLENVSDLQNTKCYMCVNGSFYWFGTHRRNLNPSCIIVSFNMATDACKVISEPYYPMPGRKSLGVFHESVALYHTPGYNNFFDVWTLNDDSFWTKKLTVGPFLEFPYIHPIGHWKDNKIMCETGKLALYDLDTLEMHDLGFERWSMCLGVYAYFESLVSLKKKDGCPA